MRSPIGAAIVQCWGRCSARLRADGVGAEYASRYGSAQDPGRSRSNGCMFACRCRKAANLLHWAPKRAPARVLGCPLLEHHGAVVVDDDAILQVPPHRLGQHRALQVAALQVRRTTATQVSNGAANKAKVNGR